MIAGKAKTAGLWPPWKSWCDWALATLEGYGISGTVTSGLRDSAKQQKLYSDFIAGRSTIPAAPPGRSSHEYGLALDFVVDDGKDSQLQRAVMDWFQAMGAELVPGDPVHIQYPGFRAWLSS